MKKKNGKNSPQNLHSRKSPRPIITKFPDLDKESDSDQKFNNETVERDSEYKLNKQLQQMKEIEILQENLLLTALT